ncbi:MAG: cupin domain-containing protein, partial [Xanthobacteraceae bacterium]|nr:cupin domain-containing protein [Xanthobacteraceae bacterium]
EGEKANMSPGDFILTPNWAPHDHGNLSNKPMLWLDVLDMPTVNHFETSFSEHFDEKMQNTSRSEGDSLDRYGSGVLPDGAPVNLKRSPVINYTYARTRPILERMKQSGDIDKHHGARVRYANPINGSWALPTMGAHLALLPAGFKGAPYRSTDGMIFVCAEGRGSTKVGDQTFEWEPNDVFVVPPWIRYSHNADKDSVLFSISDRPMQEALGIWREETGN